MAAPIGPAYREQTIVARRPGSDMLDVGTCEPLKAAVHGVLMTTVALCAAYNAAAWFKRRQPHLAVNAIVYTAATIWEHAHVVHHLIECQPAQEPSIEKPHPRRDAA